MRIARWLLSPQTYYRGYRDIPRLLLGAVFLASAFIKHLDPFFFLQAVQQYHQIPLIQFQSFAYAVVIGIVAGEYLVGFCEALRLFPRLTVVGALALNALFVGVLALHWGETFNLGCGCFGFPKETVVGIKVFWKNFVLLAISIAAGVPAFADRFDRPDRAHSERAMARGPGGQADD